MVTSKREALAAAGLRDDRLRLRKHPPAATGRSHRRTRRRQDRRPRADPPVALHPRQGVARPVRASSSEAGSHARTTRSACEPRSARSTTCSASSRPPEMFMMPPSFCATGERWTDSHYVPEPREEFWPSLRTTLQDELGRYDTVIHLRTPAVDRGYNHSNPLRTESAAAAAAIDARILEVWVDNPDGSSSTRRTRSSTRPPTSWRSSAASYPTVVRSTPTHPTSAPTATAGTSGVRCARPESR